MCNLGMNLNLWSLFYIKCISFHLQRMFELTISLLIFLPTIRCAECYKLVCNTYDFVEKETMWMKWNGHRRVIYICIQIMELGLEVLLWTYVYYVYFKTLLIFVLTFCFSWIIYWLHLKTTLTKHLVNVSHQ